MIRICAMMVKKIYLKSPAVNSLRHRLKKRVDLFRRNIEVQYKSHMMKYDVEDI